MPDPALATTRVAIYARVSSEEQREGQTIDSQIAELERFARAQDWLITGLYKDEGWSGAVLARPALDRLRDDASKKLFDIVLLNDVDRLARDVAHLGVIKRALERQGLQVRFRKLPAEQSPTANLMVNILGSFAEFEREMIADRTRRGRRHKVETRQQFLGCLPPYGYRYVKKDQSPNSEGSLELLPEQATIVRQMFQWVDQEGSSAHQVLRRLNELGVRPRKGGQSWGKSSVLRILHCETYVGAWHYNKFESYAPTAGSPRSYRRSVKYKLRLRPRAEWIRVQLPDHLRIIDRGQWERVQAQLARNRSFAARNARHAYLLRGLVVCGGCQARYVGDPNHGRFYYRCHQRCKRYPAVREELLNQTVWEAVAEAILNPALIVAQAEQRARAEAAKTNRSEDELRAVNQGIEKLAEEERRILEAYRLGVLTPALLGSELEQLKARRTVLAQRQTELKAQHHQPSLPVMRRKVVDYCQEIAQRLGTLTTAERQRLLQLLIERVIFKGAEIIIKGFIPLQNAPRQPFAEAEEIQAPALFSGADGIAATELASHSHNSVKEIVADGIAATELTDESRNSVTKMAFELSKSLLKVRPLSHKNSADLALLKQLAKDDPQATLRQLRERI
jgi:site-specific DNA recombinase